MKARLEFDSVRWKNLLSTGNTWTEIILNDVPNALIVGDNGSGKSTLLDAICMGLYGKPFRKIRKNQVVNAINGKDCEIEVNFHVGKKKYKVVRKIKPDDFEIYANGTILNKNSEIKDYQAYLEKFILGMNFKTFTQIVIAGSASFVPFMQETAANRRSFVEDLLDIRVFASMSTIVKQRLVENKDAIEKNKLEHKGKLEKKAVIEKNISKLKVDSANKIILLETENRLSRSELIVHSDAVIALNKKKTDLEEKVKDYKKHRVKHDKLLELRSKIKANYSTFEEHYKFFDSHDSCPTCKQLIEPEFKGEEQARLDAKLMELEQGVKDVEVKISQSQTLLAEYETDQRAIHDLSQQIATEGFLANQVRSSIKKNVDEINILNTSNTMLQDSENDLKQVILEIDELEAKHKELLYQRTMITTAADLLKDGGIKTKIIKQYLPIINKTINKYLAAMGFLVHFHLDETFDETIKSRYRDDFCYENFSEGEKMRIDLALLFTWRTIATMKNSVSTNLLILDEVFDGALDNAGIEDFLKIMSGLTQGSNTFIISHKQDQMIDKFKKVYKAVKRKNFSYIEVLP